MPFMEAILPFMSKIAAGALGAGADRAAESFADRFSSIHEAKTGEELGQEHLAMMNAAYPGTSSVERLGVPIAAAQVEGANIQARTARSQRSHQSQAQRRELETTERITDKKLALEREKIQAQERMNQNMIEGQIYGSSLPFGFEVANANRPRGRKPLSFYHTAITNVQHLLPERKRLMSAEVEAKAASIIKMAAEAGLAESKTGYEQAKSDMAEWLIGADLSTKALSALGLAAGSFGLGKWWSQVMQRIKRGQTGERQGKITQPRMRGRR